jgi:UDP-2,4-diacetamido-2,4,6-trideoxy-beta-L-altropyranose hydrolase
VVDHYGLDASWELRVAPHTQRILVIDDLANRRHECDALLDQNYYAGLERRYDGLVPRDCRLHLGPAHVLLRREFRVERAAMRERDGVVRRILVAFGSSDESGETIKALAALRSLRRIGVAIDVVAGATNPRRDDVRSLCAALENCTYHEQVDYIARLIGAADLGLGAGGSAMWERCVLGLPSLTAVTAANQLHTAVATSAAGAIVLLGEANAVTADAIAEAVVNAIDHPSTNREITKCALNLVPSAGGADRLAAAMSANDAGGVGPGSPASGRGPSGLNQTDPS